MPEELLDVVFVGVRRRLPVGDASEAEAADEVLDRAGAHVAVVEAGIGEATGVDAATVTQGRFEFGREFEEAEAAFS
jgi:hypothetical protein